MCVYHCTVHPDKPLKRLCTMHVFIPTVKTVGYVSRNVRTLYRKCKVTYNTPTLKPACQLMPGMGRSATTWYWLFQILLHWAVSCR